MRRARRLLLGAAVGLAAAAGGAAVSRWVLPPGDTAPVDTVMALRLPDLAGVEQPLAQWRGRVLVVNFWATWCAPCREEIPVFVRMQTQYGGRGLQLVGIAIDEPAKVRDFAREFGINYPVLLGALDTVEVSRRAGNQAGVLPYTLILDRKGVIARQVPGGITEGTLTAMVTPLLLP